VDQQRRRKLQATAELFSEFSVPLHFDPARSPDAYRNRVRLRVVEGVPTFFNSEKSLECAVLQPALRRTLGVLRQVSTEDRSLLEGIAHLELRAPDLDLESGLLLVPLPEVHPDVARQAAVRLEERLPFALLVHVGGPQVEDPGGEPAPPWQRHFLLPDLDQFVPLDGFMQVNPVINQALVQAVARGAQERGIETALDLYCGSGNFGLALSKAGISVTGVDSGRHSVLAANRASRQQGLPGTYLLGDAGSLLAELQADWSDAQLAVVDPPRAGLKQAIEPLLRLSPRVLAFCSCRPSSLLRDVAQLCRHGYRMESLTLFDMFCHTEHVEALAWLRR
jgi:tRNA/tmRNA/rRNA uracil-C5-methylase (TrmA/RlmC/RlmD family)